jgi:hypothetical protein
MKPLSITFILLSLSITFCFAQKFKEGRISYFISYQNLIEKQKDFGEMKRRPSSTKFYFKNRMLCEEERYSLITDIPNRPIHKTEVKINRIYIDSTFYSLFLKDKIVRTCIDCTKPVGSDFSVIYTEETKNILSYKCKKVIVKHKKGEIYTIFYTEDLPNTQKHQFPFLKGCPLEFETSGGLINVRYIAFEINTSFSVSDEYFKIPEDYKMIKTTKKEILDDRKTFMPAEYFKNDSTDIDKK